MTYHGDVRNIPYIDRRVKMSNLHKHSFHISVMTCDVYTLITVHLYMLHFP